MNNSFIVRLSRLLPDKLYLSLKFRMNFGRWPNWKNPQTFSEKLQWLKLYDRRPEYTQMVDKYAVKEYVAGIIGEEYVIPTLGVWDKPEEIEWDKLPDQFVLKTTHGGGSEGVVICRDKTTFDRKKAIEKLNKSMQTDLYKVWREWPYKNVPKRIIAEQYIETKPELRYEKGKIAVPDLPDYKWYCFDGEPKYCQVIQNRNTTETIDFFDTSWVHQEFVGLNPLADNASEEPSQPEDLDVQIRIARELSKGIPFSRIDLYSIRGETLFGEITLYPNSGVGKFRPENWNIQLGEYIKIPINENPVHP